MRLFFILLILCTSCNLSIKTCEIIKAGTSLGLSVAIDNLKDKIGEKQAIEHCKKIKNILEKELKKIDNIELMELNKELVYEEKIAIQEAIYLAKSIEGDITTKKNILQCLFEGVLNVFKNKINKIEQIIKETQTKKVQTKKTQTKKDKTFNLSL